MSVTLKQIAERTGLSVPTVGNVLGRASARYSEVTRKKVFAAVQEMGYRANSSARAIRQGKIGCVALVLSRNRFHITSHIPAGLFDGLDQELSLHNMHISVSLLSDEELSSGEFIPKVLREYVADGMIVNYTHEIPAQMLELIHAHHTPAVWMNAKLSTDCVYPDDRAAANMATAQLIRAGHRRITFVHLNSPNVYPGKTFEQVRPSFHYSVLDRLAGYSAAMKKAGLSPRIAFNDRFVADEDLVTVCGQLLSGPDRPTAVIAYSEYEVAPVLFAAAQLKISLPDDLTVLGFAPSDRIFAGMRVPAIQVPTTEMGRRAVRMLLRKIESPDDLCECEAIAYEPLKADAIAAPKTAKR